MKNLEDVYRELQGLMPASSGRAEARPAAVSVLWRQVSELEIYLVRRAATMRFLPGFWTFPGGKEESGDGGPAQAASRELEEETGVRVDPGNMSPAGRWVTPSISPLRFDTHYFLAQLEGEAEPDVGCSDGELVDGAWWRPADALAAFRDGELLVPAPVIRLLAALVPGMDGASQRAIAAAAEEERAPRLWDLAGGVSVSPLRTPTLPPATHTNCYVVGTGELIIVDPATPEEAEREAICQALDARIAEGQEPVAIYLTHHHGDHVGAAEHVSQRYGIPICAHERSAQLLEGRCRVDATLADGDRRVLAGPLVRELVCVFTPGHAAGHLCFYETHTQALIAGDMVASQGTILIDPSEGDMSEYLESLEIMRALKARMILPAHGMALSDPEAILDHYREHRLMRESKAMAALGAEFRSVSELVKLVYSDTPEFLHGLAQRSLLSHLLKLEKEGRARQNAAGWATCP